jgi:lipoprotein-anchoring transpeptidase ErfK/SrfK
VSRLAVTGLLALAAGGAAGTPAHAAGVPVRQSLVVLWHDHVARAAPMAKARPVATVPGHRPLTHVRTVLPVLGHAASADGRSWVQVALPGRPNGLQGWISTAWTSRSATGWRLSVGLAARRVTVYHLGQVVRRFRAVVGAPSTPTPRGRFFIEEAMSLSPWAAGGPFALASSARSDVLQEFDGGPGQIALHGMNHLSGALGTASSHGCIRLSTAAITWLSRRIGAGVPLSILR